MLQAQIVNAASLNNKTNHALKTSKHITLLSPKTVMAHIRKQKNKPLVVLFSSFDIACHLCANANQAFYKLSVREKRGFEFVLVNTQPWLKKELETSLYYKVNIKSPVTLVLYKTKVLKRLVGDKYSKMTNYLTAVKKDIHQNKLALYGDKLTAGNFSAIVISDKYQQVLSKYLAAADDYKALAVASNKRNGWTASRKMGYLSQQAANSQALQQCNDRWHAKGYKNNCKLYMISDQYVYNKSTAQIKALTASLTGLTTRIDKHALKLKSKHKNTALAYSVSRSGNWTSSYVFNKKSEQIAVNTVLKNCEKSRLKKNLNSPCKLYFVNDKFVTNRATL
ncbi:MAG: hypothetical protein V7784_02565 [Oceanospirillaceae bacterium]